MLSASPMLRAVAVSGRAVASRLCTAPPQAHGRLLARAGFGVLGAPLAGAGALQCQRRTQYMPVEGKRDQEAFLTQFDPMDVLCVEPDCNIEDIDAAFERMKAKYAANGTSPDAKMLDRVFRAHEILKDPDSPYYVRAHSSQTDRQRLQFQLLPKNKRRFLEIQVGVLLCVLGLAAMMLIRMVLQPMKRSIRAGTR